MDSNPRPAVYKTAALPTELLQHNDNNEHCKIPLFDEKVNSHRLNRGNIFNESDYSESSNCANQ